MHTPKITCILLCLIALTPNNLTCSDTDLASNKKYTQEELEDFEEENKLQMQIRVLQTQIKKQKLRYNKILENEIKKSKNEYQEIINEKNKLIQDLEEKQKELNNKNERLQKKNDRLEIQQKASDYNEIRKSLSERLSRTIWQMNETEDKDDKELLQMRTQFKDLKKQSRFFKKISNTVIKYNEQLKKQTQDNDFYSLIRQDVDKTYEAYNNPQNQNNSSEELEKKDIEINKLKNEVKIQQQKIKSPENQINALKEELEKKKTEIKKLKIEEGELHQTEQLLLETDQNLDEEKTKIKKLKAEAQIQNNKITILENKINELKKKEAEQEYKIKGLRFDNLNLGEELAKKSELDKPTDEVSGTMQLLTHRNQTLQDELDKKNQSIQNLKKEVSTLSQAGKNRDSQVSSSNEKGNTLVFGGIGLVIGVTVTLIFTKMYKKSKQQAIEQ